MATNIQIKYPNFCFGPIDGTFCTINQDVATTIMRIKTSAGGFIADYTLSSNIINELIMLEYVGPEDLNEIMDSVTFFTVEKVDSTRCIIKRWETRPSSNQLNLKYQKVKYTTGSYYYDINGAAVEYYRRSFSTHNPGGINYLDINNSTRVSNGDRMFLGPSNDADNLGVGEYVTVSHVVGSTVYFTSNIIYQYVIGDQICFYKYVYLSSALGIGGDTSRGTMFKLNANNGGIIEVNTDKVYQDISGMRWCPVTETIATIHSNNMLFVNPYVSYLNWKSMYLNNIESNNYDVIEMRDVLFEDYSIYKLMQKETTRDDDGNKSTEDWGSWYNYASDTLLPYTNCIEIYTDKSVMVGQNDTTTFNLKVIDQYGVGLSEKTVNLYLVSGDLSAVFDPVNGQVTTDINGEASVDYTSGTSYTGKSEITCRADGSSAASTGSEYVWNSIFIYSEVDVDPIYKSIFQEKEISSDLTAIRQFANTFTNEMSIWGMTFFTTPGGDWINPSQFAGEVSSYLPGLIVGPGDGPAASFTHPTPPYSPYDPFHNSIRQVLDFESDNVIQQWKEFAPDFSVYQMGDESNLQLSQLKVSTHTYWLGGAAYDYLWTHTELDQFIFVEDAIPKFWSEKNPIVTNIWIRLRPFAYSLDVTTVRFYVREVWFGGDTGNVDVSSQITYQYFDAGGGILGVELTYNPSVDFHHDSVVYVLIEIYDTAPSPNYLKTNYWFTVTPDYKAPYLDNLNPAREQSDVVVNPDIYFEIKDAGAGVDIDSLEMTVDSRSVTPTSIVKISDHHYQITYTHHKNFYHDKRIIVGVKVDDLSNYNNWLNDRYAFYIVGSEGVFFTDFEPGMCKRGLSRFQDVSFVALGIGDGVDGGTLRLQIHGQDVTGESTVVPIIYRIS